MRPGTACVAGLYPLLSEGTIPLAGKADLPAWTSAAGDLAAAGVTVLQLRLKTAPDGLRLALQRAVAAALDGWTGLLVLDDRADLAAIAARERTTTGPAIGLHLGQTDLPPALARAIVGPDVVIGLSTHDHGQVAAALGEPVDYLGFGPVFPTRTKANPDPVTGIAALTGAARLSPRPVVAIGGIGREALPEVLRAGASAAAVVGLLWPGTPDQRPFSERARDAVEACR